MAKPKSRNIELAQLLEAISLAGVAAQGSVTSNKVSIAVAIETSNRISADTTLSNAISVLSDRISALKGGAVSTYLRKTGVADYAFEWGSVAAGGGGAGSVTSANFVSLQSDVGRVSINVSAISTRLDVVSQQVSVISQQVSVLSQSLSSQAAALSVRIDTQSQSISVLSQQVSVLSQSVSSQAAALSVRVDTQSQSISVLSQQISVLSQQISVLSQALSVVSNAASNALSVANAASNAASIVSVAAANATSIANAVSQAISVLSAGQLSAHSQAISVLSQQVSVLSADVQSIRVNAISNFSQLFSTLRGGAASTVLMKSALSDFAWKWASVAAGGAGSGNVSIVSVERVDRISADNILSNAISTVSQQLSLIASALSARIDTQSQSISVLSQQVSVLSQQISVHSQQISVLSQQISVLSQKVSTLGAVSIAIVGGVQTISATVLTNISGLSLSVSATGTYEMYATILYTLSTNAAPVRFGLTFPAMTRIAGVIHGWVSANAQGGGFLSTQSEEVMFTGNSASGSTLYSAPGGTSADVMILGYYALMRVSTTGVIQLQAFASTTTGAMDIQPSSFIKVFQIA